MGQVRTQPEANAPFARETRARCACRVQQVPRTAGWSTWWCLTLTFVIGCARSGRPRS